MRKGFGICCIVLGICCLIASAGCIVYNHWEEEKAQSASADMLQNIRENILVYKQEGNIFGENTLEGEIPEWEVLEGDRSERDVTEETSREEEDHDNSVAISAEIPREMLTTQVNGYDCIGVISIPVLEMELPVLTDWSYEKLKVAPCHYFGSCYEKDFVIAAHNYPSQFGRLSELQPRDLILFTDISGTVHCYEVILLETLPANATEEMITSGFDLSLYTCTPGGANRVTVRCNAVGESVLCHEK